MSLVQPDIAAKHAATAASSATSSSSSTAPTLPEGWIMEGDLANLAAKESQEMVLYTRALEKGKKESEDRLAYIVISRTEEVYANWIEEPLISQRRQYRTGDHPVTLSLFFKNEVPAGTQPSFLMDDNNRIKKRLQALLGCQIVELHLDYSSGNIYLAGIKNRGVDSIFVPRSDIDPGISALSFRIGCMRAHIAEMFFDALVTAGILKTSEAVYFRNICGHAIPSEFERKNLAAIESACAAKQYQQAVELAKAIHDAAMKTNRERYKTAKTRNDQPVYYDDENSAFLLGMRLRTLFPNVAIEAFELLTEESPNYAEARQELAPLYLTVQGNEAERRSARRKAIEDTMRAAGQNPMNSAEPSRMFLKLFEEHCGFKSAGTSDRLFAHINPDTLFSSPIAFFEVVFHMSDVLHAQRKASGKLNDESRRVANDALVFSSQASVGATSNSVRGATAATAGAATAAASASTSSSRTTGSLDDDDVTTSTTRRANLR